jgi:hypothetical protein
LAARYQVTFLIYRVSRQYLCIVANKKLFINR